MRTAETKTNLEGPEGISSWGTESRIMRFYAATHTGSRKNNEDSLFAPQGDGGFFAVVADGMGGHNAGEVASRIVVDTIERVLSGADPEKITKKGVENMLTVANTAVYSDATSNTERLGMGSTATVAVFSCSSVIIGQIGDSRAYLFRNDTLKQITKDHSYVQLLIESGHITHEQAQYHPQKNIITRAIGTEPSIEVDTFCFVREKDDIILLCTDGLSGVLSGDTMAGILHDGVEKAADTLVEAALSAGGTDNISVVIAYEGGGCG